MTWNPTTALLGEVPVTLCYRRDARLRKMEQATRRRHSKGAMSRFPTFRGFASQLRYQKNSSSPANFTLIMTLLSYCCSRPHLPTVFQEPPESNRSAWMVAIPSRPRERASRLQLVTLYRQCMRLMRLRVKRTASADAPCYLTISD